MEDVGVEYLTVKSLTSRPLSIEDDLRALVAQYTGDETVLELFQATKLSRYLPGKPLTPSPVEVAAYRYAGDIIARLARHAGGRATAIIEAYRSILLAHDIELLLGRAVRGEQLPSEEELIAPGAPEVSKARRMVEEEAKPAEVLAAIGFEEAARVAGESLELLSAALDLEVMVRFRRALETVRVESARELLGLRVDMAAARVAYTLVTIEAPRRVVELYTRSLAGFRLPVRRLVEAVETRDREGLESLLKTSAPQALPEGVGVLEGFTAAVRRHSRRLLARAYIEAILEPDTVVPPLEQALLDAEDAVVIAIAGFSRQPKQVLAQLLSLPL